MNRAISRTETVGAFRLSLNLLRNFSAPAAAAVASPSTENPSSDSIKPKRRKKKNLIEVAQFLPNWGIGYHMAKAHWNGVSYEITKINLYKVPSFSFSSVVNKSIVGLLCLIVGFKCRMVGMVKLGELFTKMVSFCSIVCFLGLNVCSKSKPFCHMYEVMLRSYSQLIRKSKPFRHLYEVKSMVFLIALMLRLCSFSET